MAIALVNKQKHKEKFRLVDNPKITVLGLVHEPPEEIRYSSNAVARMVETSGKAYDVKVSKFKGLDDLKWFFFVDLSCFIEMTEPMAAMKQIILPNRGHVRSK